MGPHSARAKLRKKNDININSAYFFFNIFISVHIHLKNRSIHNARKLPVFGLFSFGWPFVLPGPRLGRKGQKKGPALKRRASLPTNSAICACKLLLFKIYQPFAPTKFAGFLIVVINIPGAGLPGKYLKIMLYAYVSILPGPLSSWLKKNCCAS